MARIPREIVDAIRDRTDIATIIGRRVKLQKRGNSLVGLCPFHQEKTPSFHVIPNKSMYHCFGCQAGGDVFGFLMAVEGLSFVEAVKELAGAAGIPVEEEQLTAEQRHAIRTRATLFDVLAAAADYFESMLWAHADGQGCRDYLRSRNLSPEIAREARVGFAPDAWRSLVDHLHRQGFPIERLVEAGLARENKSGDGYYDFFRNRLMFPIMDDRSRVIGFGGRVLEGDGPKYLNTGETSLYSKSNVLYGIEKARNAIQRADQAIVVEGYFDVLALRTAGHHEAVASCGTALTTEHLHRLSGLSRNLVMLTDGDNAGQEAAVRALPLLIDQHIHGFRVDLPGAKDPWDYLQEHGPQALSDALARRRSLVEWVVDRRLRQYADPSGNGVEITSMSRERVLEDLRDILARLPTTLVSKVAARLGMPEETVLASLQNAPRPREETAPGTPGWQPHRDVVHVLWLVVHRYDQVADLLQRVDPSIFDDHPQTRPAISRLLTGEPVANVVEEEPDPGVARAIRAVVARDTLYTEEEAAKGIADVLNRLIAPRYVALRVRLRAEAEQADRDGDMDRRSEIWQKNAALQKRIKATETALKSGNLSAFVDSLAGG